MLFPGCTCIIDMTIIGLAAVQMGVRSRRSRLDGGDLLDPSQRHQKARRAEEASLDASLESSGDISSTSDDEDACTDATDLSLMSEAEASCCAPDSHAPPDHVGRITGGTLSVTEGLCQA